MCVCAEICGLRYCRHKLFLHCPSGCVSVLQAEVTFRAVAPAAVLQNPALSGEQPHANAAYLSFPVKSGWVPPRFSARG